MLLGDLPVVSVSVSLIQGGQMYLFYFGLTPTKAGDGYRLGRHRLTMERGGGISGGVLEGWMERGRE